MATILYARVSTTEQTIEHQRTQAEKAGFKLDKVIWDDGVSGVSAKFSERVRGGGSLTCCGLATRWSFDGLIVLGGTIRTSVKPSASSCSAGWWSAL